ncbi:MAG: hypothetical protein HDQ97_15305 [Lachnospiraceae bacterium]|nr:hypothetical protein [Lachnospiraceae bacterium]
MKHTPYRQNPTVIDISKKARPPPGKIPLINMNCLIILIWLSMPFCLSAFFVGGLFLRFLVFLKSCLESATKEPFPYG